MSGRLISFVVAGVLAAGSVSVSEAQMINYKRRNQRQSGQKDLSAVQQKKSSAKQISYYRAEPAAEKPNKNVSGDPLVTNRVERLYDLNRDGYLQSEEVNDFYKDVVSSVENKGSFRVSSELLRNFDANQDGRISRYEVGEITNQIN